MTKLQSVKRGGFSMVRHGEGWRQAQSAANLLEMFIGPLEEWLDDQLDRRLVRTFFLALAAMVRLRHSRSGLLLSELGAHILTPDKDPAGTKRLSNLLRSPKWSHTLLDRFLWYRADLALADLQGAGESCPGHVGRECPGEVGKHSPGRIGAGTLQQGRPPEAHQARLLQSSRRPAGIRPVPVVDHGHGSWLLGPARPGGHALVEPRGPLATDRFTNLVSLLNQCSEKWGSR